jgi:hypothetical protein
LRLRPLWALSLFQFRRRLRRSPAQVSRHKLQRLMPNQLSRFVEGIGAIGIGGTVTGVIVIGGTGIGGMVDSTALIMGMAQASIVAAGAMAVAGDGAGRVCISVSGSKQQLV